MPNTDPIIVVLPLWQVAPVPSRRNPSHAIATVMTMTESEVIETGAMVIDVGMVPLTRTDWWLRRL